MVNDKRLKQKLPELLIDGPVSNPTHYNDYFKKRYQIQRLARTDKPSLDKALFNIKRCLEELERRLNVEL